jgi:ADP-heptose:LPS heptosyltransferase
LFFKICGVPRIEGIPWRSSDRACQLLPRGSEYEYEAKRLARCIAFLGDANLHEPGAWDLRFQPTELARAEEALAPIPLGLPVLALSVGTKVPVKEWGEPNWSELMEHLASSHGDWGLLLLGSKEERALCDRVSRNWPGPVLNLCGKLTPRESAAALRRATVFLGQDSGPMHLAAAGGIPCVAVFSARDQPGVWYPYGENHRVLYHALPCANCKLEVCELEAKACITSITVPEVQRAFMDLAAGLPPGKSHQP